MAVMVLQLWTGGTRERASGLLTTCGYNGFGKIIKSILRYPGQDLALAGRSMRVLMLRCICSVGGCSQSETARRQATNMVFQE